MTSEGEANSYLLNLTDAEIYDAIRYLEPDLGGTKFENHDKGVVTCLCLYVVLVVGLVLFWLNR